MFTEKGKHHILHKLKVLVLTRIYHTVQFTKKFKSLTSGGRFDSKNSSSEIFELISTEYDSDQLTQLKPLVQLLLSESWWQMGNSKMPLD